jgi:hypothetical protein
MEHGPPTSWYPSVAQSTVPPPVPDEVLELAVVLVLELVPVLVPVLVLVVAVCDVEVATLVEAPPAPLL